jgi:hypothetical protein
MAVDVMRNTWIQTTPATMASRHRDTTQTVETERRHKLEDRDKDLQAVQDLEKKLGIPCRWEVGGVEWEKAEKLVTMRKYQRAIDNLEGLVVARIFELTKMNMSQTGLSFISTL